MFKKIIPFFFVALTVGFISCSSSSPLVEKAETNIAEKNYEAAITAAEQLIQKKPNAPIGYYYLGVALGQKAQAQEPPSEGTRYFKQANEAFQKAKELASQMQEVPEEISRIDDVQTSFWRLAHNEGVNLLQNDSLRSTFENPLERSLAFLNNTVAIQPNHPVTYQAIAIISGRRQNYAEAAEAQQKFISMTDSVTVRNYLVLAQYYRRADMPEEALQVLTKTQEEFPDNMQVTAFLADAYTQLGEYEKAITLVEALVERNPENPQYRLSLGSRILISSSKLQDKYEENVNQIFQLQRELGNASGSEAEQIQQQIEALRQENRALTQDIEQLQDRAEEQFKVVLQYRPDGAQAYNNLGVIYQNRAALYYDLRNLATTRAEAAKYDRLADDLLKQAMNYYERAVELDPDNKKYWRSLYSVYTTLGLDEKANEAARKAGIK